ncbi:energy transducer TonB [Pontibacter toksunensis]|uniref:Energy transducer TonB n=1 Tax=Pontibacter toksunensis TaxID=1332631 RepID=A0ABW6BWK3_9BACT
MEKSYYLSRTFNKVVFEGRNQAYGAYVLRRTYGKHMALAAIIATAIFSGALVGPLVESIFFEEPVRYVKPDVVISGPLIIMPPPPKMKEQPKKEVTPVAEQLEKKVETVKHVTARVVEDNSQEETSTMADVDLLSKLNIGKNDVKGEIPGIPGVTVEDTPPTDMGMGGTGEAVEPPAEFIHVEEMPEFVGGDKALFAYLSKKMRYPSEAQRAGVEGIVVVTFVVAPNGAITKAEVVKGLGFGTEEEALRVISSMPYWKPGKQNGRTVPVRYTLPIRFNIQ